MRQYAHLLFGLTGRCHCSRQYCIAREALVTYHMSCRDPATLAAGLGRPEGSMPAVPFALVV